MLGLAGLIYLGKFIRSWDELRQSAFGLERENAQTRLNQAASMLVLLLTMTVAEFTLVSFVAPSVPGANPLLTPTLDLLATPTITLIPEQSTPADAGGLQPLGTPALSQLAAPAAPPDLEDGCTPGEVMLSAPEQDSTVSGIVEIIGTADIDNFGFYKFETAKPGEDTWLSIQAGNVAVQGGLLGNWDTTRLDPGTYRLRLVVVDNQGEAQPACAIRVNVTRVETP